MSIQAVFAIADASATKRGAVNTLAQTFAGVKTFADGIVAGTVTGSFVGNLTAAAGSAETITSNIADGASAVGVILNNSVALANGTAKLLSIRNNGVEKASFDIYGRLLGLSGGYLSFATAGATLLSYGGQYVLLDGSNGTLAGGVSSILKSTAADSASAVAGVVDTNVAWSTAGSKLLSIRNNAVEKLYVAYDGTLVGASGNTSLSLGGFTNQLTGTNIVGWATGTSTGNGIYLQTTNGASATDVGTIIGTIQSDAATNAAAKLLSVRTGIGGTQVESLSFLKNGVVQSTSGSGSLTLQDTTVTLARSPAFVKLNSAGAGTAQIYTTTGTFTGLEIGSVVDLYIANSRLLSFGSGGANSGGTIYSSLGAGASDVAVKVGSSVALASVNPTAALLRVSSGIGGTETESMSFYKNGVMSGIAGGKLSLNSSVGARLEYSSSQIDLTSSVASFTAGTVLTLNGTSHVIKGSAGAGASDVAVTVGSSTADTSVVDTAKLLSIQTGIGGTPVEQFSFLKGSVIRGDTANPNISLTNAGGVQIRYGSGANLQVGIPGGTGITMTSSAANIIQSTAGSGGTDVLNKVGTNLADASVSSTAKLVSFRTGIGGTEVERAYFAKDGLHLTGGASFQKVFGGNGLLTLDDSAGSSLAYGANNSIGMDSAHVQILGGNGSATGAVVLGTTGARLSASIGGATDTCTTLGSSVADGTVNASAKLLSVRTGIGGSEVEQAYFVKGGLAVNGTSGNLWLGQTPSSTNMSIVGGNNVLYLNAPTNSGTINFTYGFGVVLARVDSSGQFFQSGTDTSGTPGNATVNKPRGIAAIAVGASTVRITNSLATATSHITITPYNRDATCKELVVTRGAGFFDVSGTANATAALSFSWEVGGLL